MDRGAKSTVAGQTPARFQFHLGTAIGVVTSFAVIFSLVKCHPVLGTVLSGLFVGSWWSRAAVRAGWRELAYYLAAWPMSVIVFGFTAVTFPPDPEGPCRWPTASESLFLLSTVYLACLLTATLLRPLIRRSGFLALAWTVVVAVHMTAVSACVFSILGLFILGWAKTGGEPFSNALMLGIAFSTIWTTLLMPLAWPVGFAFCTILRRIDRKKAD